MTKRRYLPCAPIAIATAILMTFLVGCGEKEKTASAPLPPSEAVLVIFEGPWGFAPDPGDPNNSIIAIAPATSEHHDLYVKASYSQPLKPGRYDLAMPPRTVSPSGTIIGEIFQTAIDPKAVSNVLNNVISDPQLHRYAVRLPKPESYRPYTRYPSSVGPSPHPAANGIAAKPWATGVSLLYTVGGINTFKLAGTPDSGTFTDFPLQLDTRQISFVVTPLHDDDPSDLCYLHDRKAFHHLTTLLGLTHFVDFQGSPSSCPAVVTETLPPKSEKKPRPESSETAAVEDYRAEASVVPETWFSSLFSGALLRPSLKRPFHYFFAAPTGDCKSPNIVATQGSVSTARI